MKVTFPLRTLGGTVIPELMDNPVTIPPTLLPVTLFPSHLESLNPPPGAIQTQTFISSTEHNQPASTASFALIMCTFGAGLWELDLLMRVSADFNQTPQTSQAFQLQLQNPQLNAFVVLLSSGAMIGTRADQSKFTINFGQDGWTINAQSIATIAAQTYQVDFSVHGKRLA